MDESEIADARDRTRPGHPKTDGKGPVLFLDFDGVLHPDEVYLERGRPVLRAAGRLFMWAPLLEAVLAPYPQLRIVLSTSWARELRFGRARDSLPPGLRSRVIGATWHSGMGRIDGLSIGRYTWWDRSTRYEQIRGYVDRAGPADWVAVDDNPEGWADADLGRLVRTNGSVGLSSAAVLRRLEERVRVLCDVKGKSLTDDSMNERTGHDDAR